MKKILLSLATVLLACALPLWADEEGYTIKNYAFQGVYHADNTVSVKETIDVEFQEPRHGLYRQFPGYFYLNVEQDPEYTDLKEYRTAIKHFSAGAEHVSHNKSRTEFKMGSKLTTITGPKQYELTYTFVIPDDRTKEADFIYYSLLGAEWGTTIDHFSYVMEFENGVPENLQLYSGNYGDRENTLNVAMKVKDNVVYGSADNLEPYNAVTLYACVDEGYFSHERISVISGFIWLLFALSLAWGIFKLYQCLKVKGKSPVQTVEFYPPENLSSCQVGTIIDGFADTIDFVSLIPVFARKGYLEIHEEKVKNKTITTLKKLQEMPETAPEYEKKFFDALFCESDELNLDKIPEDFPSKLSGAKADLQSEFTGDKKLFKDEKAFRHGLLMTLLTVLTLVADSPVAPFNNVTSEILPEILLCISHWLIMVSYSRHFKKSLLPLWITASVAAFGVGSFFFLREIYCGYIETIMPWWCSLILLIVDFLVCLLSFRMVEPSDWNLATTGKLMGLKEFIKTAEMPKLQLLMDENPEYFYDVLPYAMVFGLTKKWADAFQSIEVNKPAWYHTLTPGAFTSLSLERMLDAGVYHTINATVAKAEAASSGGGFSGGGGGGGGGGSW